MEINEFGDVGIALQARRVCQTTFLQDTSCGGIKNILTFFAIYKRLKKVQKISQHGILRNDNDKIDWKLRFKSLRVLLLKYLTSRGEIDDFGKCKIRCPDEQPLYVLMMILIAGLTSFMTESKDAVFFKVDSVHMLVKTTVAGQQARQYCPLVPSYVQAFLAVHFVRDMVGFVVHALQHVFGAVLFKFNPLVVVPKYFAWALADLKLEKCIKIGKTIINGLKDKIYLNQ